jgi:hypothetical protein
MGFLLQCTLSELNAMALSELHFSLTKLHCTLLTFTSPSLNYTPYSLSYISPSLSYTPPSLSYHPLWISLYPLYAIIHFGLHCTLSELHCTICFTPPSLSCIPLVLSYTLPSLSYIHSPHPLSYSTVFDLHSFLSELLYSTVPYTPHCLSSAILVHSLSILFPKNYGYIFSSVGYVIFLV